MLTLYDDLSSGNGYKIRLLLTQRGIPFQYHELQVHEGETRTPEFLAINPNGKIPVLVFDDGRILSESNAILYHFAQDTPFFPDDAFERARVMQWMFFEQYSLEPYLGVARFWTKHPPDRPDLDERMAELKPKGDHALGVMDKHLTTADFFVGGRYSIADIALYAYTHVAEEGGFDLAPHTAVRAWIDRVADQPGHILITQSAFG